MSISRFFIHSNSVFYLPPKTPAKVRIAHWAEGGGNMAVYCARFDPHQQAIYPDTPAPEGLTEIAAGRGGWPSQDPSQRTNEAAANREYVFGVDGKPSLILVSHTSYGGQRTAHNVSTDGKVEKHEVVINGGDLYIRVYIG